MPIIKEVAAPNGAVTTFHRVTSLTLSGDFSVGRVQVTSWVDQDAYALGLQPSWNWYPEIPYSVFTGPPLVCVESALIAEGSLFSSGAIVIEPSGESVEAARAVKNAQINAARWLANNTTFTFGGKQIAVDPLSRSDIDGAAVQILNEGALPSSWPGVWKAVDNTYVSIPDLDTWKDFYQSMYQQGLANFVHAQALKTYINAGERTVEEIQAVTWGMTLP